MAINTTEIATVDSDTEMVLSEFQPLFLATYYLGDGRRIVITFVEGRMHGKGIMKLAHENRNAILG